MSRRPPPSTPAAPAASDPPLLHFLGHERPSPATSAANLLPHRREPRCPDLLPHRRRVQRPNLLPHRRLQPPPHAPHGRPPRTPAAGDLPTPALPPTERAAPDSTQSNADPHHRDLHLLRYQPPSRQDLLCRCPTRRRPSLQADRRKLQHASREVRRADIRSQTLHGTSPVWDAALCRSGHR